MKVFKSILALLVGMLLGALLTASQRPTQAALYWLHGVRDRDITVCFVGAAVTVRPDRVEQIIDYIEEFEKVANIRFYTVTSNQRLRDAYDTTPDNLTCPGPGAQGADALPGGKQCGAYL